MGLFIPEIPIFQVLGILRIPLPLFSLSGTSTSQMLALLDLYLGKKKSFPSYFSSLWLFAFALSSDRDFLTFVFNTPTIFFIPECSFSFFYVLFCCFNETLFLCNSCFMSSIFSLRILMV